MEDARTFFRSMAADRKLLSAAAFLVAAGLLVATVSGRGRSSPAAADSRLDRRIESRPDDGWHGPRSRDHALHPPAALSLVEPHVVVIKSKRRLYLFDGPTLIRTYAIGLGPQPAGPKHRLGDGRTPEGMYRICTKKRESEHYRFLGISYPGAGDARFGLAAGLLTTGEVRAILEADVRGRCPPWTTPLGGGIGLHGGGAHRADGSLDWTAGCIALDDADVSELFDVLRLGDPVEILP